MREGMVRIPSGCAISGIISTKGIRFNGEAITRSIACMHERANGLGGGFVGYGIYPAYRDLYALHLMYETAQARADTEEYLGRHFTVHQAEPIPTRKTAGVGEAPMLWRYFVWPKEESEDGADRDGDDYVTAFVMTVNGRIPGAFVFSSGRNMGVFKGVGFPADIARFFRLEEYEGYMWVSHGRFPTNTPGWWGGAHPLGILDWSVVHNGEVSSYGINKRYLEMFGYCLELQTDTEVIAYLFDLLHRRHGVPLDLVCRALTAPFWKDIDRYEERERAVYTALRRVYGSAMLNGPFSIIVAFNGTMLGLNDRIKLRPMVCGRKDHFILMGSEESALREAVGDLDTVWNIRAGERFIARLEEGVTV
jgi:glutamate synthase domain-containing protein 1